MTVDARFLASQSREVFTGNEAVVKGALEAEGGVHLLGGYPGSPIADFFNVMAQIKDLLAEKGIRAVMNSNEALAAAMMNGSQLVGCRTILCVKSVGVHVAADALALANLAGAHREGGAVVLYGDDPWSDSTQVPADSRFISKHLFIPVLEPATPQEVKDFVDLALKVSRRSELVSGLVVPTNLADGGGSVVCRPNQYPTFNTRQKVALETAAINLDQRVLLPPKTWWQEQTLPERHERAIAAARELGLNRLDHPAAGRSPLGFIAAGMAHAYLLQALEELGLTGRWPILKFGLTYPLDAEAVCSFARQCRVIVVVEERRGFLEEQAAAVLTAARQDGRVPADTELWGKSFPGGRKGIPSIRGLHPSILVERLLPLVREADGPGAAAVRPEERPRLDEAARRIEQTASWEIEALPGRTPTFCPGCPHRDSASVCLEIQRRFQDERYMRRRHRRGPVDLLFHGDTGCYTMLMFPPNTPLMHDYSGMGLGGGTGAGTHPFVTNKEVVFMGDGTFFHSGQLAISQAVKLAQDITFIILDNSTTAMTGHQPTSGVDYDIVGGPTAAQDIAEVVAGMAGDSGLSVVRADPEKHGAYRQLLERTFLADGVKVVIATKECGITRTRRRRRQERALVRRLGYLPAWEHMNVTPELCTFCLACAELTGCPGLKHAATEYGPKMDTDLTWCVNDGACERIGACSAFERVTIRRRRPQRPRAPELDLDNLPEPPRPALAPEGWTCCLAGVGGMGLGVATSILVRAGHAEGYHVLLLDKKGLAIRNGATVSQVVYHDGSRAATAVIPYGQADVLLGIDLLEAARAIDPKGRMRIARPDRTAAVVNTEAILTILGLMGQEDPDTEELERAIRAHTRTDAYAARNVSRICQEYLGNKLYANIMTLGMAFQMGLIPVSLHSIAWALKDTIRTDLRKNLYAFNIGRKLVVQPELFPGAPQKTAWRDVLEEKCRWTVRRYRAGERLAEELRELAARTVDGLADLEESLKTAVVVRLYDCLRWGGISYAERYARAVAATYAKDSGDLGFRATRSVIHNLAEAMLIRDAVFMAELAAAPEKYARDRKKYGVNPAQGDRIRYQRLWNVPVRIGRWSVTAGLSPPNWALELLKRCRFLRKVLPAWHRADREYLRQYEAAIAGFSYDGPVGYEAALAALAGARCLQCMTPLCREAGCPLHGPIPDWVDLAWRGRWQEASDLLHQAGNFPEITSRVCPAPCQDACKQGLKDFPVRIRDIERGIADRAWAEGWVVPRPAAAKTGRRVAVVGSGPAGLAAAQQLARAGHKVVVLENQDAPGGLLRWGIPDERLDKALLDRRIDQLRAEGVAFRTGVEAGRDISGAELREQFDAVLLATGALRPRDLAIPGRQRQEVCFALEFLRQRGLAEPSAAQDKVVTVIGGGETGNDCVEAALRRGARQVHQLEILPATEARQRTWTHPGGPAVHRRWAVAAKSISGDHRAMHLEAVEVQWFSTTDGRTMREVPESDFRIRTDLVVLAMGFDAVAPEQLARQLGLETDPAGRLVVRDHATSLPGVFAAGDVLTGPSLVAGAIQSGRKAAERIEAYLAQLPRPAEATATAAV